ncbi:YciI family protein [Cellulomonas sp. KH9]|uniref:YciI family protein n=1 Tax=Cellulomonas sp. KH9 TaxID=1855324 RepID=UPI0008E52F48|nr:YciI family protein [Cellulomonas sp. KH9]SFK44049.1 YCII-related domain-containing protein [Cellulomonas sp. KH9]
MTSTPRTWTLLLWGDPDACLDLGASYAAHERFAADCAAHGHEILGGEELASPSAARLLRVGADGPELSDGPFAELTEQLGGFYLIRTADPDGLLHLAAGLLQNDPGTIELRPVGGQDEQAAAPVDAEPVASVAS